MKKLAKTLNKIFTDKTFIEDMSKNCNNIRQMQSVMGRILTYYISTRDTKIYSFQQMRDIIYQNPEPKNIKRHECAQEALIRNIIDQGFVTHSFNGFNLKKIKKYGLGSDKNYDTTLGAELARLEKDLGKSEFIEQQTNGPSEIYYTSPGTNSIYYAMQQSPERLFNGPLFQGEKPLPVLVGEKKEDYYLRVAIDKINKNYRLEEQQPIIDNARKVIKKLCSQRPQLALIPINSKKYALNANLATINGDSKPLTEYLQQQAGENMAGWVTSTFFANCFGGIHPSNCSNLVSTGVVVPASELEFVGIPDSFEILQVIAKQKGLKPGEKFDLNTLEKVEEKESEKQNSVSQTATNENTKEKQQEAVQYDQTPINDQITDYTLENKKTSCVNKDEGLSL